VSASPPRRSVAIRLAGPSSAVDAERLSPEAVAAMLVRAQALGLSPQLDPQIAALLAAVRLRDDVPAGLYTALAAVLGTIYAAGEN
jgi:flagellar biosynthesis protein